VLLQEEEKRLAELLKSKYIPKEVFTFIIKKLNLIAKKIIYPLFISHCLCQGLLQPITSLRNITINEKKDNF
jgi:hypothetical protein